MLRKLPRRADRITAALADGRFTTNLRLFSDPRDISVITTLVNRAQVIDSIPIGGSNISAGQRRISPLSPGLRTVAVERVIPFHERDKHDISSRRLP
jgi:hypothetical protein